MKDLKELFSIADSNVLPKDTINFINELKNFIEYAFITIKKQVGIIQWNENSGFMPRSVGEFQRCEYVYSEEGFELIIDYSHIVRHQENQLALTGCLGFDKNETVDFELAKKLLETEGILIRRTYRVDNSIHGQTDYIDIIVIEIPRQQNRKSGKQRTNSKKNKN